MRSIQQVKVILTDNLVALRRYAYSLTNDMNDADDLVQTVVEKLLNKSIPSDVNPLPWIFKVSKNAWVDELRSRKVRAGSEVVEADEIADSHESSRPSDFIQQQDLLAAIESLPEAYKAVMSLIVVSGLTYSEAAETLDVPIGTIMSRVARAREKLASRLNSKNRGNYDER